MSDNGGGLLLGAAGILGKGLTLKIAIIAGILVLVGVMLVGTLAGAGGSDFTMSGGDVDPCNPDGATGDVAAPQATGTVREQQLAIAATADQVATDMNMPGAAVLIILMAGFQESGVQNLNYGDRDSIGWLQQRPSQGWLNAADVAGAARDFYATLRRVPGWTNMSFNDAAQAVQRSGWPYEYAKHEDEARALAADVGADLTRAGDPYGTGNTIFDNDDTTGDNTDTDVSTVPDCQTIVTPGPNPDGTWPAETATICPDPTNGRGCITPRTGALVAAIRSNGLTFPSISCWDAHTWNPSSDHPKGRACDIAYSSGWPTADQVTSGDQMADWILANAGTYGVHYVIWQGRIWFATKGVWETYNGAGIYNVNSPSGGHYDHIHISVY